MIKTHKQYIPMYEDTEKFIILVTGGRGSGKSFSAGTFIERLTFDYNKAKKIAHKILFTRYTMVSASISVIPEFTEKIDLDEVSQFFHKSGNDVTNTMTGSVVMFRGIHTSSGNQTAKLKSIHGITTFVVDEAEEWVSEDEFEKIMLSIRTKGLQNRVIIIMNPCDSNHWVYKRFIKDTHKIVEYDGVPVQISTHPNVLHIHTTYLDNLENLSEQFLAETRDMKEKNPERYAHIVMGQWADVAEGAVFKKWGIVDEFPDYCKKVARGSDFGYTNDVTGIVRCGIVGNKLYIDELCYRSAMTSGDLIREFRQEEANGDGGFIYSESADPRLVDEISLGGVLIYPVQKGPGSIIAGLTKMLDMEIYVTKRSVNLQEEMRNYVWAKDRNGEYVNEPEDHDNHCFVGDTMVITEHGEKRIDSLDIGENVLTSNGYRRITRFFNNGIKETMRLRISLVGGKTIEIEGTPDHKVKSVVGWIQLQDLHEGNVVYVADGNVIGEIISHIDVLDRRQERVFDIEVEDMHEFFANGMLVHNCIDAARYYVLHQLLGHPLVQRATTKSDLGVY